MADYILYINMATRNHQGQESNRLSCKQAGKIHLIGSAGNPRLSGLSSGAHGKQNVLKNDVLSFKKCS